MNLLRMTLGVTVLVCAAVSGLPAQNTPDADPPGAAHPSAPLPPELERVLRDYERAWAAGDAAALAALFDEDGFALSPGRPPVRGRSAIEARYRGARGTLQLRAIAYGTTETIGYIVGMFGYPGRPDGGKFLLALRRDSPRSPWLIAADMDNPNTRPGGTP